VGLTGLVEITCIRTCSVGVDLMDGDLHDCSRLDCGDCAGSKSVLGVLANIDVARYLCSATLVDDVGGDFCVADDGSVLLARADVCAVSGNGIVDCIWLAAVQVQ